MAETGRGVRVQWEALRNFCEEVLGTAGVPHNDARIVAAPILPIEALCPRGGQHPWTFVPPPSGRTRWVGS